MAKEKIKIVATFIGKDGSLGFKNNTRYALELSGNTIYHKREFSNMKCVYNSVEAFIKNWRVTYTVSK